MTAKEKAKELINSFRDYAHGYHDENETYNAKKCALICVDREIQLIRYFMKSKTSDTVIQAEKIIKKKEEVKQEIEKL